MTKAAELAKWGEVSTNGQVSGRRNIIINGAMKVAQRSTSVTGIGGSNGYFTVDRFHIGKGDTAGRLTMTQTADGPSGFANCIKLDCTTADTSVAAGELLWLEQKIEGQDLQQFKKGTSDAEQYSVSFYVKGNANATYALALHDTDNSRHIVKLFSVTTAWTRITMTFPADTTGAFNDDNAHSLSVRIWLHAGSTYTSGTLQSSAWAGLTAANRAAGITSFFDSTDRTFFLTGLQLEVGSVATPFEHRSFGEELVLCQRYCHRINSNGSDDIPIGTGFYNASTTCRVMVTVPTTMRAASTFTTLDSGLDILRDSSSDTSITLDAAIDQSRHGCILNFTGAASTTAGEGVILRLGTEAANFIEFDAEL